MAITPEIEADVLRLFRQNPKRFSPFKASKQAGCTLSDVITIIQRNRTTMADGTEHNGGNGRADLQPYIVAKRRANEAGWDNTDPAIVEARELFAAGTHDMATHRDGAWLFLCLFPLNRPRPAQPQYFTAGVA